MEKLFNSDKIYVKESSIPNSGRGVFARCDIKKGEIVERCPTINVPENDLANLNESVLVEYFFYYGEGLNKLLVSLGFGSIYNHSYEPNAEYKIRDTEQLMDFVAIADIKQDSEITVNYIPRSPKGKIKLWFE